MSSIIEFQKKLLADKTARAAFAANPKKFLGELGVKLPAGIDVPDHIDPAVVESSITAVAEGFAHDKSSVEKVDRGDANSVIQTLEDTIPLLTRDLVAAKTVYGQLGHQGDAATVAVVGAVVAAVVAVPVATFGRTSGELTRIYPELGIEKVSRGALGVTVHGPQGLRIEGLSVKDVAALIKSVR